MNKDTGEIRVLRVDERPRTVEVRLTKRQAGYLSRLPDSKRPAAFAKAVSRFAQAHPGARPEGLTDEEWRAQRNVAKAIRRARARRKGN